MNTFPIQPPQQVHILILGGGFGGMYTARHLQRLFKQDPHVHITLVDRHNYFRLSAIPADSCVHVTQRPEAPALGNG